MQDLSVQIILYRKQCQKCVLHLLWDSLSRHLHRISVLVVLSGQVTEDLKLRGAYESYLTSKMESFVEVIPELMN